MIRASPHPPSPDNREYTVVPTILLDSPKGSSDEKCLGPTNSLIQVCHTELPDSLENKHSGLPVYDVASPILGSGRNKQVNNETTTVNKFLQ
jgi:hypothetical protein